MSEGREEKATPARRRKAREQGDVVRSRELTSGLAGLAALLTFSALVPEFITGWRLCFAACLHSAGRLGQGSFTAHAERLAATAVLAPVAVPLAAVLLAGVAAAALVGACQMGGLMLRPQMMAPRLSRVSPAEHAKQIFSTRTLLRVAKSLVPAAIVASMAWQLIGRVLLTLPVLGLDRLPTALDGAMQLAVRAGFVMVAWAALDYAVEYRAWSARLRMSKQEIREELRDQLGNPQIKARVRQAQRAMRRRRVKADMRRAAVVITNPTHYAVALEFSFDTMQAPLVLAKGRDLLALEIRSEARDAGVPLVENPPLARSLYRSVEPGQPIPYELYAAIAGILAYLLRERQSAARRDAARADELRRQPRIPQVPHVFHGGM